MDSLLKVGGLALTVMLLSGGYQCLKQHGTVSASVSHAPLEAARHGNGSEHFSPAENLEQLEISELTSAAQRARATKRPLDIAIYAFTHRALAALLAREAEQGTDIRIYRDGEQYEQEERNAARFRDRSTTAMFRGQRNIHVRVKAASRGDLMHLKVWSDGQVLREGSANWSPSALKRQDNNVRFSHDVAEARAFEADFEAMWVRPSNRILQ